MRQIWKNTYSNCSTLSTFILFQDIFFSFGRSQHIPFHTFFLVRCLFAYFVATMGCLSQASSLPSLQKKQKDTRIWNGKFFFLYNRIGNHLTNLNRKAVLQIATRKSSTMINSIKKEHSDGIVGIFFFFINFEYILLYKNMCIMSSSSKNIFIHVCHTYRSFIVFCCQ